MIFPKRTLAFSLGIIIVATLSYIFILKNGRPRSGEATAEAVDQPAAPGAADRVKETPLPVKAVRAGRRDLVILLKSPGDAFTEKKALIKAEVSGVVKEVKAEEGKRVRAGEVLVVLDEQSSRLRLEKAEAERLNRLSEMLLENQFGDTERKSPGSMTEELRLSNEEFEKAASRLAMGKIGRAEFDKVRNAHEVLLIEAGMKKDEIQAAAKGLTQAEIEVAIARMEIDKTKVRAPFDGIVTGVKASTGESVSPGQGLFTLVDIREIRVEARILESEIGRIKAGREADLRFAAYPGRVFRGKVRAVSPVVDPETKTCGAHIVLDNPSGEIKPGMHAEVEIAAEVFRDRLLVPQGAVLVRGGRKLVFVVGNGLAKWRYIEPGLENERFVEVLEGVKEGDEIITDGHLTLAHDAEVKIVE
jgi:RND family efflux transporter MFP subunit